MTDTSPLGDDPPELHPSDTNPSATALDEVAISQLRTFGTERTVEAGDLLFRAGDDTYDFIVMLEGEVEILRTDTEGEVVVATHGVGRFLGELSLLTGQRAWLTARVSRAGRVLAISPESFRRLMSTRPDLADPIFTTLVARREYLRTGEGAKAIRIIGSRYSQEAMALRAFAAHRVAGRHGGPRRSRVRPHRPGPARRDRARARLRSPGAVPVRDVGARGVRGRRRAPRLDEAGGRGRRRRFERRPLRARPPRRHRPDLTT